MSPILRRLVLGALLLVVIAASLAAQQARAPASKVLVLRNRRVLRGDVTRLGDRCLIVLDNGGQIQLATREIAVEATSLDEAYQQLRDSLTAPEKIGGHLDLASWCIREGLYRQASEELRVATQIKPQHPEIERLQRQLAYLSDPKPTGKTTTASASDPAKAINPHELENVVRSMPKPVVEEFTASVQLLLVNRCGTSHCHDSNSSSSFTLLRPASGEKILRRMTLRNLQATRAQIDLNNIPESPLLKMAASAHGGLEVAPLMDTDQQFQSLSRWVREVSPSVTSRESVVSTGDNEPGKFEPEEGARPLSDSPSEAESQDRLDEALEEDPFDPAAFNERYLDPSAPGEH